MAGLIELLGIERTANTESQAAVDLGVVGEGSNAEVVDLGLQFVSLTIIHSPEKYTYLGERSRVKLVLGCELEADVGARL